MPTTRIAVFSSPLSTTVKQVFARGRFVPQVCSPTGLTCTYLKDHLLCFRAEADILHLVRALLMLDGKLELWKARLPFAGIESAANMRKSSFQSWRLHGNWRDVLLFSGEKMKHRSLLIAFLLCFAFPLLAQNPELKALAEEDQAVRQANPAKGITRNDRDRDKLVLELLAKGAVRTPEDKFNAALVLQHTPLIFCGKQLVSMSPDNYLLAHYLFKESFEAGYAPARIMVANSIDRYMSMTEGRQKYGTNRITNQRPEKMNGCH